MTTKETTKKATKISKVKAKVTAKKEIKKEAEAKKEKESKEILKVSKRYIFATGRRKSSVANVRLFEGKGESLVNKKPVKSYFDYCHYFSETEKPFNATGLLDKYYYLANIKGGGASSQAGALRHGISIALGKSSDEVRKVLKKNGFLTRDDRKKERKKPGLKRARRSPQWSKR